MMPPNPEYSPWSGLLTASPFGSQQAPWSAQTQAPWRLSPWSTQGMPSGAPVQNFTPPLGPIPQLSAESYLPQGTSETLPTFDPMVPGGNFYPGLLGGGGQQRAPSMMPAATAARPPQQIMPRAVMGTGYRGDAASYNVGGRRYSDYGQAMERAALLNSRQYGRAPVRTVYNTGGGEARRAMSMFGR